MDEQDRIKPTTQRGIDLLKAVGRTWMTVDEKKAILRALKNKAPGDVLGCIKWARETNAAARKKSGNFRTAIKLPQLLSAISKLPSLEVLDEENMEDKYAVPSKES